MQENKKLSSETSELGNVDQIREILFGSQSRELNKRFEKLEIDIKRSFDDLKSKIEFSQKEFNQKLENEVELISKRIKNLTTVQQDEFADIKDNNLKQEKRFQHSIDLLNDEIGVKIEQLTKDQNDSKKSLSEELNFLKLEVFEFIEDKLAQMNNVKLSRDDAAEIMMEAALKIKGNNIQNQLNLIEQPQE
ncbi:hypothetical protein [Aliarcobacter cibarius]|uniref:Uncharacterized protein n=1 Tax=Aliarcobacter cibarius TaxID=255507 RepID=A0A5J6RJK5_9BACT|nr:hypothetical protein [Aliarcobacter cibarius]QEZ88948.1 hypothetical protein ACIB15232_0820 [Aliarcobacter cibarius]QKJ26992.1 hypothetical protein ACBT_1080 [Aliarcobacter cibarius]TLS98508.1 hypothetical protein FE247_07200 [Aliarcobacter cibarius]TLS99182.1 hypothetical protein FE245_06960 [Aliarcobacter cibarius]TLT03647.1 hypothetical protein FE248_06355 [Aliarcobacter cibarius]